MSAIESAALPKRVLFACTSNALRSPLAEALMRLKLGPLVTVASAGVRPREEVDGMAMFVADELGADLAQHRPRGFEALEEELPWDVIVSLSPEAHHHALELVPRLAAAAEYWPTRDPSLVEGSRDQRLMEYREVRDGLARRIDQRFPRPSTG
ncbi:MAG TPA: low molecular weight phosphatase family protein [Caulobacterales bacterium]|nr:low molecular weight phosphatase family protein [Caulobacterales bacterium]